MDTIGARVKYQRRRLGLSQKAFSQKLGYSQSYLNDIECNAARASSRFLETIGKTFDISVDFILFGSVKSCDQGSCAPDDLHEKAMGMISEVESETGCRLDDKQRRAVALILEQELKKGTPKASVTTFVCACGRGYRIHELPE